MNVFHIFAASCSKASFFGLPTWYAYLPRNSQCSPQLNGIADIWLIVAAIIELLLRLAAIIAVFMVVFGGITYTTSMGNPEDTTKARQTLIYALVGLLISVAAAFIVTFVAKSLGA